MEEVTQVEELVAEAINNKNENKIRLLDSNLQEKLKDFELQTGKISRNRPAERQFSLHLV